MLTLGFAVLLFASIRLSKNQPKANPAVAFSLIWLVVGFVVEALPFFVSISFEAKLYMLVCSTIFVFGVVVGNRVFRPPVLLKTTIDRISRQSSNRNGVANTLLVLLGVAFLAGGIDLFIYWIQLVNASKDLNTFFSETRWASVSRGESIFSGFGRLTYFHTGAQIHLFLISLFLMVTGRISGLWKVLLFLTIAFSLLLTLLEGARSMFFYYLISFVVMAYMRGLISHRKLALLGFCSLTMFVVSTLFMRASAENWDEGLIVAFNHILIYFFAPTPLFGLWFAGYGSHLEWYGLFTFLNKFGFIRDYSYNLSSTSSFLSAGSGLGGFDLSGNVYTAFAVVMDNFGVWALIYWLVFGTIAGVVHAWSKWTLPCAIYSLIYPSILLTIFWEYFFSGLETQVRLIVFFTVFQAIESLINRRFHGFSNRLRQQ